MNAIQTDTLLFQILTDSGMFEDLTGGIYTAGERPVDSNFEDIVLNNISFDHSTPKRGITNVNIHVPDITVEIDGVQQTKTNRERLEELNQRIVSVIESTVIDGVALHIDSTQFFAEQTAAEHYLNIRVSWIIAKPYTNKLDVKENILLQRVKDLEERVKTLESIIINNN